MPVEVAPEPLYCASCVMTSPLDCINAFAIVTPGFGDALQNRTESRPPVAIVGRKIRAAEKRLQVRREKHRHGPTAAAGGRLHERHVDAIHIRPLLAIHLHRHEPAIQNRGQFIALKRLALHDVAPVASGIADRQKNGLVFGTRFFERRLAPRIPVHRIVGVLLQVGTFLADQMIGQSALAFALQL